MATPPDSGGSREPLNVCGVEVDFPFRPYPCQLVYMEKVVESLQRVGFSRFGLSRQFPAKNLRRV